MRLQEKIRAVLFHEARHVIILAGVLVHGNGVVAGKSKT